jgi:inorganic pyrophosphatase
MDPTRLPTWVKDEKAFHVVIESPRGSRAKLAWDKELHAFKLSRPLALGLSYPYDWGFIPSTHAADGDPLDALVVSDLSTAPGVVIECRALAVVSLEQDSKEKEGERERNDRIIAMPLHATAEDAHLKQGTLGEELKKEVEAFFLNAVLFQHKNVKILGWDGAQAALAAIKKHAKAKGL